MENWTVYRSRRNRYHQKHNVPEITPVCPRLVNDVYSLIYQYLDPVSQTMMALSNKLMLRLGIPGTVQSTNLCGYVARNGYFKILRWLHRRKFPWDTYTCSSVAAGGHLEILKWLRPENCRGTHLHMSMQA